MTNSVGLPEPTLGAPRAVPGVEWKRSDSAGLSFDGKLAGAKTGSREVVVVRLDATNRVTWLRGKPEACRPAFSADHRWVVTASENGGGPCLWEAGTGEFVRLLHAHPGNGGVQFSPDGRVLVTSDTSGVRFYDVATWTITRHWPAEIGSVLAGCAAFTPDSRLVAVTTGTRELRLADSRTGEVVAKLITPETRPINEIRFSRDGRTLAVSTTTDAVDLWDVGLLEEELEKLGLGLGGPFTGRVPPAFQPDLSKFPLADSSRKAPRQFPARSPEATAAQLDLAPHFNVLLTEEAIPEDSRDNSLLSLPRGLQTFAGVTWDVRGLVQLGSTRTRELRLDYPEAVRGIKVSVPCRRLHFLMAAAIAERPGTEVGHFTIRFEEGKTVRVPLRLGEEIADWWFGGNWSHRARLGEVAWEGDNESTRYHAGARRLQLSKWTWENPRPGTAVKSVDFVSAMTRAAPFLIAITAE